jgi:hypothetical protein
MISRKCCCTTSNTCCDPILKDQFVTLFDTELDSACPVSDQDLIVLKINRPGAQSYGRNYSIAAASSGGGGPGGGGPSSCPKCCRTCSADGCLCGRFTDLYGNFDITNAYYNEFAGRCTPCCCSVPSSSPGGCSDSCQCRYVNTDITCGCPGLPDCPPGDGVTNKQTPNNVPSIFKKFVNRVFKNPPSFMDQYKITSLGYLSSLDVNTNKKLKENEKQVTQTTNKINFQNERFKSKLEFLSRCKKCLQDNNIDIDCVDDDISINCQNKNTNICENCSEECSNFCDPIYGGTPQQIKNSEMLLSNVNYQDDMIALDPELDTTDIYAGKTDVSNLVKSLGEGDYGNNQTIPVGQNPCTKCVFSGGNPAAPPIYFIYRYSSCNFIWYPPEYVFNYNRTPSQCPGYLNPKGIKTCDYFFGRVNGTDGSSEGNFELTCGQNVFDSGDTDCSRDYNSYPCQCTQFPHLSGGIYDTLQRRINVSKKQFFGGYIAGKNPFLPKVNISELGCCTCFTTQSASNTSGTCSQSGELFNTRRGKYLSYPKASGWGSSIQAIGIGCTENILISPPAYNPNYRTSCFSRGISPYLSRISISLYTLAFDIFHYGSDNPAQQETLGATYRSSSILEDGKKWTALRFTKMYNKKDSLYNKLVGIVSLEHHFESWAYHSKAPFSPQPPLLMNHALILLLPYERPYAGFVKPCSFQYEPRAAMRWQILHYTPRTVMYGSSGVPIFFSDLYAFEHLSREKNILIEGETFNGSKFLEQYYLYFYNNLIKPSVVGEPYVEPKDVAMYSYVSTCLTEMIRYNIISIKDHAKDIADELIEILDQITVETIDSESVVVFPNNFIKTQIGGSAGYNYLITFLKRLIGFDAGNNTITDWASLKPYVTAKVIKRMINPESLRYSVNLATKKSLPGPMFLGPRRVKLIPTPLSSGLTAWGCENAGCDTYDPYPLDIQSNVNLVYSSVHTNDLGTNFAITVNGKVQITGNNSLPECLIDSDPANFTRSLGCVPLHLSYRQDLQENPDDAAPGSIEKISCKGKFAVALVSYGAFPIGNHRGNNGTVANRRLDSNSGVQAISSGPSDPNYGGVYRGDTPTVGYWGVYPSCPGYGYGVNDNTFALKTWGPDNTYGIFYNPPGGLYYCPSSNDESIRPNGVANTMPLKNRYRLWVDVAAGAKHCVAITGDGCLFVTPDSDNTYDQMSYGKAPAAVSVESDLTYIENMPVPGYFKDIEWNGDSLSLWKTTNCSNIIPYNDNTRKKCDIRCYLYSVNNFYDLNSAIDGTPGYYDITPERPFYINVGAGQYHSIAVSSDQNLKVWGSYVKVDQSGNVLQPNQQDITGNTGINPIPAFTPINLINPDKWTLGGITLGCRGVNEDDPDNYVYTTAKKDPATIKIFQVDGGPDYSLAVTGSDTPVNVIIWGHSEMVSALNNTAISGLTGSDTKSYNYIEKIIAGVNSFGVLYRRQNNAQKFLDIFTRPSRNTQGSYDFGVNKLPYTEYDFEDAALSYGHAIGIVNSGFRINTWKQSSFNTYTGHNLLQFTSTGDLPLYFQSQAFFRCVKGHWDFSKWLFGRSCKQLQGEEQDNEVILKDECSIYWKKGEANLCFTGHPKYYWMKPNDRRYQKVTPLHTRDPQEDLTGCGLMRDENGDDGLQPIDYGTGNGAGINGDTNRQLGGLIGGCYSGIGDICWVGDGSPSAFQYSKQETQFGTGFRCDCEDVCGCPPESETYYKYACGGPKSFVGLGTNCFDGSVYGRSGFSSNKDFFVQSHKYFGKTSASQAVDEGVGGVCCGVVDTNITYFYYAKKCFYYGYNSTTGLYEVKDAPLKYRSYYWGDGRTGANPGATSAVYMNYTMTPEDCIVKYYQVDYYMQYPTVYVGGNRLQQLKQSFSSSINLGSRSTACQDCYCSADEVCSPTNTCQFCSGCKDKKAGANLLGPGGWIYNPGAACRAGNIGNGVPVHSGGSLSSSIALFDKTLYLEAGASTYLGPLVKFGPYTGRLPPGFTALCYTGPACPCPNYDAQCAGCNLQCNANAVYDVLEEYDIDDLTKYNLVGDKITYTEQQTLKLFRVYEELKSTWIPTGMTLDPVAFQGGWDLSSGCGNDNIDRFYAFLKYQDGNTSMIAVASDLTCVALTN